MSIPENAAPTEAEQKRRFDSFVLELNLVEGGIQRAQTAIYTSFGVVLQLVGWLQAQGAKTADDLWRH
jgi:hypothetical protein